MTRTTRLLLAGMAGVGIGLGSGCGSKTDTPAPTPAPVTPQPPAPPAPTDPTPAPAADPYELDPAKHAIPAGTVSGKLAGKPFSPDAAIEGNKLTFRTGKDFIPDATLEIDIPAGQPVEGSKIVLSTKGEQPNAPVLSVGTKQAEQLKHELFADRYALTLELGKRAAGKLPGKIYLCLPDDAKSYLAGTFDAEWIRAATVAPDAEEAPFVKGKVVLPAGTDKLVTVRYVGKVGEEVVSDLVALAPRADIKSATWVRSTSNKPRVSTLVLDNGTASYDFVKLPAGRYLVAAQIENGPSTWQWADVKAGGQLAVDLALDAAKVGKVNATVPPEVKEAIRLVPADLGTEDPHGLFAGNLGFTLGYEGTPKDGKATIANVAPGKYEARTVVDGKEYRGTVEVLAGKDAALEMKLVEPKKK